MLLVFVPVMVIAVGAVSSIIVTMRSRAVGSSAVIILAMSLSAVWRALPVAASIVVIIVRV